MLPIAQQMDAAQDQLQEFTIWEKTMPKLKAHAMSYFDGDTQFNYSQCSKICNEEIQRFDKHTPILLTLKSLENDGVSAEWTLNNKNCRIIMDFVNVEGEKHTWTLQNMKRSRNSKPSERVYQGDENTKYDGTAMQGAMKLLSQRFKNRKDEEVAIEMKLHSWPVGLSSFSERVYSSLWLIDLTEPMYEGFEEFMKNCPTKMRVMLQPDKGDNMFCLPSTFMETKLFKTLALFDCALPLDITDDQFVNSQARYLHLARATFSDQAINRKLRKWVGDNDCCYDFEVMENKNWNRNNILESLSYQEVNSEKYITTKKEGGIKGELSISSRFGLLSFRDERAPICL